MAIIVVEIKKTSPHPDAKKLKLCEASDGTHLYNVVCGASNVRVGMKTLLAQIGTTLPDGRKIEESLIRGIKSEGMLCSAKDLNVSSESGIVDLPQETKLANPFETLDKTLISSTPWYLYKEIESFYELEKSLGFKVIRNEDEIPKNAILKSKTYWDGQNYKYRNF